MNIYILVSIKSSTIRQYIQYVMLFAYLSVYPGNRDSFFIVSTPNARADMEDDALKE